MREYKLINRIVYFVITIVFLSSMGVWIPLAIDYFKNFSVCESIKITPNNILTYSIGIFLVSTIDRLLFLLDDKRYRHKKIEFLLLIMLGIVQCFLLFFTFQDIYHNRINSALKISLIFTFVSFFMWWVAHRKESKTDPYSALGGENLN